MVQGCCVFRPCPFRSLGGSTFARVRDWTDGSRPRSNDQTWEEIRDPAVNGTMAVHLAAAKESSKELCLCVRSSSRFPCPAMLMRRARRVHTDNSGVKHVVHLSSFGKEVRARSRTRQLG
jgi:hypothetical protein